MPQASGRGAYLRLVRMGTDGMGQTTGLEKRGECHVYISWSAGNDARVGIILQPEGIRPRTDCLSAHLHHGYNSPVD